MKKTYKNIAVLLSLIIVSAAFLTACSDRNTSYAASDGELSVSETTVSDGTSAVIPGNTTDVSSEESDKEEKPLVADGVFTSPAEKLSFTLPEDWTLSDSDVTYQFSSEGTGNKFNLVIGAVSENVEEIESDDMVGMYRTTMEDFRLIEFEHITVDGKPAAYVRFSGKLSQVDRENTITMCRIQSGDSEFLFSFTQSEYDDTFDALIDGVLESIKLK